MHYVDYETFVLSLLILTTVSLVGYVILFFLKGKKHNENNNDEPEYFYIQVFLGILSFIYFLWLLFIYISIIKRKRQNEDCISQFISGKSYKKWDKQFTVLENPKNLHQLVLSEPEKFKVILYTSKYKYKDDVENILGLVYEEFQKILNTDKIIVAQRGKNKNKKSLFSVITNNVHGHIVDDIDFESGVLVPPGLLDLKNLSGYIFIAITNTNVDSLLNNFLLNDLKMKNKN